MTEMLRLPAGGAWQMLLGIDEVTLTDERQCWWGAQVMDGTATQLKVVEDAADILGCQLQI